MAQQAVVDTLGAPFPEIMRTLVFAPLGLANSTYEQPLPIDWAARVATAHPWKSVPLNGKHHVYPEMAAAGLWTTPTDLAHIGVELLRALHGKCDGFLASATIEQMLQPQLPHQKADEDAYAGLGFFCAGKDDSFSFWHNGWDEGFVALMRIYKNIGKGAVVMLNSNEGFPLLEELLRAIGQEYDWPGVLPAEKVVVDLPMAASYAGSYITEAGVEFIITALHGTIVLQFAQQPALRLLPTSERDFFSKQLNISVVFETRSDGQVTGLTISQDGTTFEAKRRDSM